MKIALTKFLALAGKKGIAPALVTLDKETARELEDLQQGYAVLQKEREAAFNANDEDRGRALVQLEHEAYNLIDMIKDSRNVVKRAQPKAPADVK